MAFLAGIPVAPLVGAWIEISSAHASSSKNFVAPLVGAWIEIAPLLIGFDRSYASLPLWERGLKFVFFRGASIDHDVAPLVGAWIEIKK